MDVEMPEMNGLDATAMIRMHRLTTGAHIPILAMTAHALQGDRDRCLVAGMDDYLAKPIERARCAAPSRAADTHIARRQPFP
jgi:CheY-like chemotaxis protein